jgi:GNAT superfamily N-acetyltransferase
MQIDYLADHPQAIPMLASWHHDEWASRTPCLSLEDRISRLAERVGRWHIPTTFVALMEGQVVGFACLVAHDMDIRLDLSPWLASVLVMRGYRRQGIGSALTERVVEEARALGVDTLYLYTYDQEQFYSRRGWSVLDRIEYRGEPVVIMALDIAA